jgi:hypothetical protein
MSFFKESLESFINTDRKNLKYTFGDKVSKIVFDTTPAIAYDYLFIEPAHEYSFLHEEFNKTNSEDYPGKSDYAIYFEKIKSLCRSTLDESLNKKEHIHIVNPNKRIANILKEIFGKSGSYEDWPPIMQFALYTNKNDKKSPRIFCAIGNYAIIHILFYDPFHKICSSDS